MAKKAKITAANIEALLPFLDIFEGNGFSSGQLRQPKSESPTCIELQYFSFISAVGKFIQTLDDNGWVEPFDWIEWRERGATCIKSPELSDSTDIEAIRKIFTSYVRQDRFCEGQLAAIFENGHIVALLRRLKEIRATMSED